MEAMVRLYLKFGFYVNSLMSQLKTIFYELNIGPHVHNFLDNYVLCNF